MGQKTHPTGFRIGVTKPWKSRWYSEKEFGRNLSEDFVLRRFVKENFSTQASAKLKSKEQLQSFE